MAIWRACLMNALHYTAFVFFMLFLITAIIGKVIAECELYAADKETRIILEAYSRPSNAYLFIASLFFVITIIIEVLALIIYLGQLVGGL